MRDQTICVSPPEISTDGFASLGQPTYRASTVVFPDAQSYANRAERGPDGYTYGLHGTPTTRALEASLSALEGAERTILVPSGQASISVVFLTLLKPGDCVLIPDTAYPPVSMLCNEYLAPRGISHKVYDPEIGGDIKGLIDDTVKLVWVETPGSATMEIQDIPAIVAAAKACGVMVGCDNTWATPLNLKPLLMGVDVVIEALTKYVNGHSDLLMGSISVNDMDFYRDLKSTMMVMGLGVSADDCSQVLRGLETMVVRMAHSAQVAHDFAAGIADRVGPQYVLHPALPTHPGHEIWQRDFTGASALFSLVIPPHVEEKLSGLIDQAKTFSIGASWGGTHSLIAPMHIAKARQFGRFRDSGTILRISIGLEDPEDLLADLEPIIAAMAGK